MTSAMALPTYRDFLQTKKITTPEVGFKVDRTTIHPMLFAHQADITVTGLRKGRFAVFANVGLGKTYIAGEWARQIHLYTQGNVIFLAPLLVVHQTIRKLKDLGMDVRYASEQREVDFNITPYWITNVQNVQKFDAAQFQAVVLDESGILKAFSGATKKLLVKMFKNTRYKLCCTATPAPNDIMEIGNHAEFLGVMSSRMMTAIFFGHDSKAKPGQNKYNLKGHSIDKFYSWLATWSVALTKPSDLGYDDTGYDLPPVHMHVHAVNAAFTPKGMLPGMGASTVSATEAMRLRKATIKERLQLALKVINSSAEQFLIWTGLNDEDKALMEAIPDAVRIAGDMKDKVKVDAFDAWAAGEKRVLVTKDSIAGMGMDMQFARNMIFFGIDFSWEGFFQAVGRMHRFGQTQEVHVHIILSEQEKFIWKTIQRKGKDAKAMTDKLIKATSSDMQHELRDDKPDEFQYATAVAAAKSGAWEMRLGDSCEIMPTLADNSIDLSVYSPPFGPTLFIYSPTERDLGNCRTNEEFMTHYRFIVRELLRITKPGRYTCVHIQDTKLYKNRDGARALYPLSDEITRMHIEEGWSFRNRQTIDKDPQLVATRNDDTDLLYMTGQRDACDNVPMNTDYMLFFRKPGDNEVPTTPYAHSELDKDTWNLWARGIWYGIKETDTLNTAVAKDDKDSKHICPLQLGVIERCVKLWSNPGELVFSPFGGIGSEGYESLRWRRRYLGIELNPNYFRVAQTNLKTAELKYGGRTLFDLLPDEGSAS